MPAIYAHFRFGEELRPRLIGELKQAAERFPALYRAGTHGPDLLFYHKPLKSNPIRRMGSELHQLSGAEFFEKAAEALKRSPQQQKGLAYLTGVLNHFILDATCHAYICREAQKGRVSHYAMETDLERELLTRDGFDPLRHRLAEHLREAEPDAAVIARFYKGTNEQDIRRAMRSMRHCSRLLQMPGTVRRTLTRGVLTVADRKMLDLMLTDRPDPLCSDTTPVLLQLYETAQRSSERVNLDFVEFLHSGKPLKGLFCRSFDGAVIGRGELVK